MQEFPSKDVQRSGQGLCQVGRSKSVNKSFIYNLILNVGNMPYFIDFITRSVDKSIIKFLKCITYIIILSYASQKKGNI